MVTTSYHSSSGSSLGSTSSHTYADVNANGTGLSTPLSNNPSDTSQRGFSELVRVEHLSPLSTTAPLEMCLMDGADFSTSASFSVIDDDEESSVKSHSSLLVKPPLENPTWTQIWMKKRHLFRRGEIKFAMAIK